MKRWIGGWLGLVVAGAALAQNPVVAFPKNYRVLIDNSSVAVLRAHYGPRETVGVHDHAAYSTVYVYLNDSGPVRFTHVEAHPFSIVRPPTHTGEIRVSPGRMERHSVENLSELPSDYLRVELKHLPVKALPAEVRIPAAGAPLVAGSSVVYSQPGLKIERTICAAQKVCELEARGAGSVVVVIGAGPVRTLHGPVLSFEFPAMWVKANEAAAFEASPAPMQLIRLVIPNPR